MSYLGDYPANGIVRVLFTTIKACGVPVALVSGAARTIKNGLASGLHATGVTLTANAGSITGLNKVVVVTTGTLYTSGDYDVILSTGSVNGVNVRGYMLGSFSIKARTAAKVWSETTRTLTSGDAVASSVWADTTRTLTSGGAVSDSVWVETTRTLTSGGVVWTAGTRILTSGAAVWAAAIKKLSATGDTNVADALLKRNMASVSGESARSPLNALRFLRNKWSATGSTLTVFKEDDATSAWTSTITTATGAQPVTISDPA